MTDISALGKKRTQTDSKNTFQRRGPAEAARGSLRSGDAGVLSAGLFPASEIPAEFQMRAETSTPLNRPSSTNKRQMVQVTPRVSPEVVKQGTEQLSAGGQMDRQTPRSNQRQEDPPSSTQSVCVTVTICGFIYLLLPEQITSCFTFCIVLEPLAKLRTKGFPVSARDHASSALLECLAGWQAVTK